MASRSDPDVEAVMGCGCLTVIAFTAVIALLVFVGLCFKAVGWAWS